MQNPQQGNNQQNRPQGQNGNMNNQQKAQFGQPYPSSQKNSQNQQNKPNAPWVAHQPAPKVQMPVASPVASGCNSGRMFIIGLIIGVAIVWVWGDGHKSSQQSSKSTPKTQASADIKGLTAGGTDTIASAASNATSATPVQSKSTITLAISQPAGSKIKVDNIETNDAVWAVVYEYNNGTFGRVLGASRFSPDRTGGDIELQRATLPNLQYFVGLVADVDHDYKVGINPSLVGVDGKQIGSVVMAQ